MIDAVNNQFNRFVQFAQDHFNLGERTAIATKGDVAAAGGTPLEERSIKVTDNGDHIGKFRDQSIKDVNDQVRNLFRKTVADMFGGERNIPASVRKQMLFNDYGKGKPLTARRIMYVKNAIDALHRTNCFSNANDPDGSRAAKAQEAGYKRTDFGKLNTAANLYAQVKGCTIGQAFDEVLAKGSIANRAMNSGSVCMKDVASFRRGIETMERTAAKDAQNREIARNNGSANSTRNLGAIADNLAEKFKNLLKNVDKAFAETNPPAQCADLLDGMHAKCRTITARMTEISKQLRKGTLTDREKILAQLFDMKEFSELSGMLRNIHIKIKDAAPGNTALLDFSNNLAVYIKSVNGEYDGLRNEYKRAVAADLLPVANQKLNDAVVAANKKGLQASIPQKIFDDLGGFIGDSPFAKMRLIESFCKELADNGDAKFRFGAEQKAELEGLFKNVLGESPRTEKAFARFVQEFEASFFAEPLVHNGQVVIMPRPDYVVAHFKANPDALKLCEIGFKLDTAENVDKLKAHVKTSMLADLEKSCKETNPTAMLSFSSGVMNQSAREYNKGYVKFDGEDIPPAPPGYKCNCIGADSADRRGFVKILEEKFDDNHKKMRQLVSFSCGMAVGLGGTFDYAITTGSPKELLTGMSREEANKVHRVGAQGKRDSRDFFDIKIAENGDVTITKTLYVHSQINQLSASPEEMMAGNKDAVYAPKHLDGGLADIACTKITATMTIKNVSDAELGDKMPDFTIDSIQQEIMDE